MHASNIQLIKYILTDMNYSANPEYDEDKGPLIQLDDFVVKPEISRLSPDKTEDWYVELKLEFMPPVENNAPYSFVANIVGFFKVNPKVTEDTVKLYIQTNATSVLYSTLREIVSTLTAKGPYGPLLLPTVSFYEMLKNSDAKVDNE